MSLLCVRCGQPVTASAESYEVFEKMHYMCFHYEFEHIDTDVDVECGAGGCPSASVADSRAAVIATAQRLAAAADGSLGTTTHDSWGAEFAEQVAALVKEVMDAREVRIEQARSAALLRLTRLKAFGADAFQTMLEALDDAGRDPEEWDDKYAQTIECPVCQHGGWVTGVVERSALQFDGAAMGDAWVDRFFIPTSFTCRVCGFSVWGEDFAIAGLSVNVELESDTEPWELEQFYEDVQADAAYEAMREDRWQ